MADENVGELFFLLCCSRDLFQPLFSRIHIYGFEVLFPCQTLSLRTRLREGNVPSSTSSLNPAHLLPHHQRLSAQKNTMRLINVNTYEMREFIGTRIPPYAILSHTWGSDEVTLQD